MEKLFSKKPSQMKPPTEAKPHPNKKPHGQNLPSKPEPSKFENTAKPLNSKFSKGQPQSLVKRPPEVSSSKPQEQRKHQQDKKPLVSKDAKKQSKSKMDSIKESLESSRFRLLNEMLYTMDSKDSQAYFAERKGEMATYHDGFRNQTARWPFSPVGVLLEYLQENSAGFKGK